MTDKELFEKTEKVFNLKNKNILIEKIYDKGNFKKNLLENTSPIKSNLGDSGVSAARAAGRGVASVGRGAATAGGAFAKGLGALGNFARQVIPGTRASRMRSAEARSAEAKARQEEIKAQQAQANLMKGEKKVKKEGPKPLEGTQERDKYDNDGRYRRVWNAYAKGQEKDLSRADIEYYEEINKSIDKATLDTAAQTAAAEAEKKERDKLREQETFEFVNSIKLNAPKTANELKNKGQLGFYTSFMLGDVVDEEDLKNTALTIGKLIQYDKKELDGIRRIITANPKLTSGARQSFLSDLPSTATKKPVTAETPKKTKPTAAQILNKKILQSAKANNRSKVEQIKFQNEKAKEEFKVGDSVKSTLRGGGDILFDVVGFDTKTGTVVVKTTGKTPKTLRKLPREIEPFKLELKPENKDKIKDTIKKAMGESFEQIVKKYR